MGFIKAFLVAFLKLIYLFKPSLMFRNSEAYLMSLAASMFSVISLEYLNKLFFEEADAKFVWLPVVIQIIMTALYLAITFIDFILGIRVSININKKPFDFLRVIDSIAKTFATIIVTSLLMFLCLVITSSEIGWAMLSAALSLAFIWLIIILYEYSSIGNHLKSLYGVKPGIFTFMDKISGKLREKAIQKIEKSFNLSEDEKDSDINTD